MRLRDITNKQQEALYMASVVRLNMEQFHDHLTDDQMAQLNPIIRNAIYTAIIALDTYFDDPLAKDFVQYHSGNIPDYWEDPELMPEYVALKES
jgi:hypothetical protein